METRRFYFGVRECGCVTAALVDDELTTAAEIADFARRMAKTKRRVQHREVTTGELESLMTKDCGHKPANVRIEPDR
jgi:hypothetical protein